MPAGHSVGLRPDRGVEVLNSEHLPAATGTKESRPIWLRIPRVKLGAHPPLAAALLGSVALAACGGNAPVARGFDSREVLPLRDPTTLLWSLTNDGGNFSLIYSTLPTGAQSSTYWSLDAATGTVQSLGDVQPASITARGDRYPCYLQAGQKAGTETLEVFDLRTGTQTAIDGVLTVAACPRNDGVLTAFLADPTTGGPVLSTGSYLAMQTIALSMDVEAIGDWLYDASGDPSGVLVAAASAAAPDAFGLYTLDLGSYGFTEDVPAMAGSTAWAAGATPAGALQSTTLATGAAQALRAVGDHFVYARTMGDGGTTMFVGPLTTGPASELALFQADPLTVSVSNVVVYTSDDDGLPVTRAPLVGWAPTSIATASATGFSTLVVWDDVARLVVACPSSFSAFPTGWLSPDGSRALFADSQRFGAAPGAVTLLSLGAAQGGNDGCVALTTAGGTGADFSPDGQALYWTVGDGSTQAQLWAAAADGSNPRMIGSGAIEGVGFLRGSASERLEFYLDTDVGWVDLHDDPIVFHDIIQQAFSAFPDLGNSWILAGYDYNNQDGTGTLGLINRDTGTTHPISTAVQDFTVTSEAPPGDAGAPDGGSAISTPTSVYDVAYLVRGRNASAQDGIWIARVNIDDLTK
jgi:hypothetical protein